MSDSNILSDQTNDPSLSSSKPTTGRPSRKRKAPSRFQDEPEIHQSRTRKTLVQNSHKSNWDPDYLLQSSRSRLVKLDEEGGQQLRNMLLHPLAWSALSSAEQELIRRLLSHDNIVLKENKALNLISNPQELLRENSTFQADILEFQKDLMCGALNLRWQAKAKVAMDRRKNGDFDAWKEQETELYWGQKMNDAVEKRDSTGNSNAERDRR